MSSRRTGIAALSGVLSCQLLLLCCFALAAPIAAQEGYTFGQATWYDSILQ
jgi:hypothetical protein